MTSAILPATTARDDDQLRFDCCHHGVLLDLPCEHCEQEAIIVGVTALADDAGLGPLW